MDLLNTLKKFKNIEADSGYTENSRRLVLSYQREAKLNVWGLVLRNLELGATFALAGVLILLIVGGFSSWQSMAPLQLSNLDPAGLKAEANAIDIQIQLLNLNYAGGGGAGAKAAESTLQSGVNAPGPNPTAISSGKTTESASSSPTSDAVSIDEALQKLSE